MLAMNSEDLSKQEETDDIQCVAEVWRRGLTEDFRESQRSQQTTGENMIHDGRNWECELVFESVQQGAPLEGQNFLKCCASTCFSQYPLRAFLPSTSPRPDCPCQWILLMSYGGGLVSGDAVRARLSVGQRCCVLLTTQSFPKVYKSSLPGECCEQRLHLNVEAGGLLAVLADPVVCYRDAHFKQKQTIRLGQGANLVLLDWYTAGRTARGEWWDFHRVCSTSSVHLPSGETLLRECMDLRGEESLPSGPSAKQTMGRFGVTGTCILVGPFLKSLVQSLLKSLSMRDTFGQNPARDTLVTASPLRTRPGSSDEPAGCVLRFAATTTNLAYQKLSELLALLFETLGDDPFHGKY